MVVLLHRHISRGEWAKKLLHRANIIARFDRAPVLLRKYPLRGILEIKPLAAGSPVRYGRLKLMNLTHKNNLSFPSAFCRKIASW